MYIAFNAVIILLVALIAYWWANQGLFSAMLHLLCVIAAGAVALSLFEVVTVGLLLRGAWFDDYAWGVTLVSLFVVSLAIFRTASDKIVHANVNVPNWANYAFGAPIGAAAGILTVGIYMIGAGMIQSHQQVMEYEGYGRSSRTGQVEYLGPTLWAPVNKWTNEFYNYLSVGTLHPTFNNTPLAQENPELYKQASLLRDSFDRGKGKLSLAPSAATIQALIVDPESNRCSVAVEFGTLARDFGGQLTLSRSQIRLITYAHGNGRPQVIHPDQWSQRTPDSGAGLVRFRFDSLTNYISSVPGAERSQAMIEFPVPRGYHPRYIQIRGTRFALPPAREGHVLPGDDFFEIERVVLGHGPSIQDHIEASISIRPVYASTNQQMGTLRHENNFLVSGQHTFTGRGDRPTRALMIHGIFEPPGTRVVQLSIRWEHQHNMFHREIRRRIPDTARLRLVDQNGEAYSPIGFIHVSRAGTTIKLDPSRLLPTMAEFPIIPEGADDTLRILFRVTEGVRIRGFMLGDVTMGLCDLDVSGPSRRF